MTDKQKRFVLEYKRDCNATQAAIRAGYSKKTAHSIGQENLQKPEIREALQEQLSPLIADAKEVQTFWTATFRDTDADMKSRLRASELLGKSNGAFNPVERSSVTGYDLSKLSEEELQKLKELLLKAKPENAM